MRVSFFKSLWCVCCGTGIFPVLRDHSTARTLRHLALMSLVTAAVITFGISGALDADLADFRRDFTAAFGGAIRLSRHGIAPEKSPQTPYFMPMPARGGLFYTSGGREIEFPKEFFDRHAYFILWNDLLIAAATRSGDGSWQVQLIHPDREARLLRVSGGEVPALISAELRSGSGKAAWNLPEASLRTADLFRIVGRIAVAAIFVTEFLGCLLLALVCTGCFALLSRFTGAAALRGLTGAGYWRVGVYAGFPGMLIGGICEALQLPYVSYGIIYATALVIYWLPASLACADGGGGARNDA